MNPDDINPPPRRHGTSGGAEASSEGDRSSDREKREADDGRVTPEADQEEDDEKVGYKNPPRKNRFQPGVSGNPRGKRKGTKSLFKLIDEELDVKLKVNERGKMRTKTKRQVAAARVVNKAVEGDYKSLDTLLKHDRSKPVEYVASAPENVTETGKRIIEWFKEEILATGTATGQTSQLPDDGKGDS